MALAGQLGVRPACRQLGISPDTYYKKLGRWLAGDRALRPKSRINPKIEQLILAIQHRAYARGWAYSRRELSELLADRHKVSVSPTAVRNVFLRYGWTPIPNGGFAPPEDDR
jgi:hypothetical protein